MNWFLSISLFSFSLSVILHTFLTDIREHNLQNFFKKRGKETLLLTKVLLITILQIQPRNLKKLFLEVMILNSYFLG